MCKICGGLKAGDKVKYIDGTQGMPPIAPSYIVRDVVHDYDYFSTPERRTLPVPENVCLVRFALRNDSNLSNAYHFRIKKVTSWVVVPK